jgi:hypothetical protein
MALSFLVRTNSTSLFARARVLPSICPQSSRFFSSFPSSGDEGEEVLELSEAIRYELDDEKKNPKLFPDLSVKKHALPFDVLRDPDSTIINLERKTPIGEIIKVLYF